MRREFIFPQEEENGYLERFPEWETIRENGERWLLIRHFPLPEGYTAKEATAAIHIPREYPVTPLDMVYFSPAVVRTDGKRIPATDYHRSIDGQDFQRWSRHYSTANPWNPVTDSIITHIMAIENWLSREMEKGK